MKSARCWPPVRRAMLVALILGLSTPFITLTVILVRQANGAPDH